MSDLYGVDGNAIQMGNMRHQQVREYNQRVKEHNDQVATTIQGLKDQVQNNATIKEAQDIAQNLWTGHGMPDKIKAYQDWREAKAAERAGATAPEAVQAQAQSESATTISDDAETPAQSTTESAQPEPVDEGSPAGLGAEEEAQTLTGRIKDGIARTTGIDREALEEGLEKVGKGATIAGAVGIGGMDLYNEYKSLSEGKGLSGDNWEEKTGNLLQLGGSISDIVGTAFPPAKLLGGVLDLSAGALDIVGEKMEEKTKEGELTTEETGEEETGIVASSAPTQVTGRVQ
jgi:hypothetical protein